jgi:hypothetical protein
MMAVSAKSNPIGYIVTQLNGITPRPNVIRLKPTTRAAHSTQKPIALEH